MATDQLIGKLTAEPHRRFGFPRTWLKSSKSRSSECGWRRPMAGCRSGAWHFCACSIERVVNHPAEDGLQLRRGRIVWMPCVQEQDGHLS